MKHFRWFWRALDFENSSAKFVCMIMIHWVWYEVSVVCCQLSGYSTAVATGLFTGDPAICDCNGRCPGCCLLHAAPNTWIETRFLGRGHNIGDPAANTLWADEGVVWANFAQAVVTQRLQRASEGWHDPYSIWIKPIETLWNAGSASLDF